MTLIKLERIGFNCPKGGNLHAVDAVAPQYLRTGQYGVGFGPLRLTPFADSTAVIDDLRFATPDDDGWFPLLTAGVTGAAIHHTEHDDPIDPYGSDVSRRRMLAATGAGLLALTAAGTASASSDDDRFDVASFDLEHSPRGLNIAVDPVVADYLPDDHTFYVSVNEAGNIGSFDAGEESLTLNPGVEGTVEIESDEALSFVSRVIARLTADDEIEYEFQPATVGNGEDEDSFADFAVGDEVTITNQPILVDPIDIAGPSATLVQMNGEVIPHSDDGNSELGEWYVQDGRRLVYVAGEDSPDTSLVNIRVNVGRIDRLRATYL